MLYRHPEERPLGRVSKDGPPTSAAILRDARQEGALLRMRVGVWRVFAAVLVLLLDMLFRQTRGRSGDADIGGWDSGGDSDGGCGC
jgi:hypothetical protein